MVVVVVRMHAFDYVEVNLQFLLFTVLIENKKEARLTNIQNRGTILINQNCYLPHPDQ